MYRILHKNEFISDYQAGIKNFQGIILTAINFTGNKFDRIILDDSKLIEVNWTNCDLANASFQQAYLGLSNFQDCCLEFANFQAANLEGVNLAGANLNGANLQGARLENTCLTGAAYNCDTLFDADFEPYTAGMAFSDASCDLSQVKPTAIHQKILSWCSLRGKA